MTSPSMNHLQRLETDQLALPSRNPWLEVEIKSAGLDGPPAYIFLLAMPIFLGYPFNLLSIYYRYNDNKPILAIIYGFKKPFGEQHHYVLGPLPQPTKLDRFHQGCDKTFYVSPLIDAKTNFRFNLRKSNNNLGVCISMHVEAGALLVATMPVKRRPLTDHRLLFQAPLHPFANKRVMGLVHYQALRMCLRDIRLQPRKVWKQRSGIQRQNKIEPENL